MKANPADRPAALKKESCAMNFVDFHCDTLMRLYELEAKGPTTETLWQNNGHIDLSRLRQSQYAAQCFACFLNLEGKPIAGSHFADALAMCDRFYQAVGQHPQELSWAGSFKQYQENKQKGLLSGILTVEEGGILEGKLERLDQLYQKGVRILTLTWNYENCLGYPNFQFQHQNEGLKPFGIEALERMDELGIAADVYHLSDGGFYDVYRYGKRPFLATHSNARALCGHPRNLTDDMIKKLAEKGGITGLNFCSAFLQENGPSTVEAMLRHLRYLMEVGGREVVALGTDFDGIGNDLEITGCQDMHLLVEAMERGGFTTGEIEAVCWKNGEEFLRRYFGEE